MDGFVPCQVRPIFTRVCDGAICLGAIDESSYFGQYCRDVWDEITGKQERNVLDEAVDSEDG